MSKIQIIEKGVLKLPQTLNVSKAAGQDGIRQWILKELLFLLCYLEHILTNNFYQMSGSRQILPHYTRQVTNPSNYRPVSLTCICWKLLEHVICSSLMRHLNKNNILYPLQHGFREKRSCETQLLEFVHDIAFNTQKGVQNDVVVMDFVEVHYENKPIQIYWKFHHQKLKVFR